MCMQLHGYCSERMTPCRRGLPCKHRRPLVSVCMIVRICDVTCLVHPQGGLLPGHRRDRSGGGPGGFCKTQSWSLCFLPLFILTMPHRVHQSCLSHVQSNTSKVHMNPGRWRRRGRRGARWSWSRCQALCWKASRSSPSTTNACTAAASAATRPRYDTYAALNQQPLLKCCCASLFSACPSSASACTTAASAATNTQVCRRRASAGLLLAGTLFPSTKSTCMGVARIGGNHFVVSRVLMARVLSDACSASACGGANSRVCLHAGRGKSISS